DRPAVAAPALRRLRGRPRARGRPRLLRGLRPGRRRARAAGVGPAAGALRMRELAALGLVALLFGVGSFYADRDVPLFALANLAVAAVCLGAAGVLRLRRAERGGGASPAARRLLARRLGALALAVAVAVLGERLAARSGLV